MPALLTICFILSGAAGLMYESIWSRYLGLFVGHSAYAQVIVLVIYLGGMSAGAAIASRRSDRIKEPLVGYAAIEVAVGLLGLFFHNIYLATTNFAYTSLFPALPGGFALVAMKWTLAALLILPQSILLGMTFPLMTSGYLRRVSRDGMEQSGRVLGMLYFANSIGAAAGVLIAGFYLIGIVGLPGTILTAAIINIVVGLTVFGAARMSPEEMDAFGVMRPRGAPGLEPPVVASASATHGLELPLLWRVLLAVAAGTALSSFMYEIAWVRMLSLVLGSATHSFELMLSAFILGLALGAFWVRKRADQFRDPLRALAVAQWAMGALAIVTLTAYLQSFNWMAFLLQALDQNAEAYQIFTLAKYGIAVAVMVPATFCAGITLPLITRILIGAGGGEKSIGAVYSVNTLGSIIGVALSALVLMPLIGLKALLILGGVIDMALGVWLMFLAGRTRADTKRFAVALIGATVLVVAGGYLNTNFDRGVLTSGVFRYGQAPKAGERDKGIVFYKDGRTATVSVRHSDDGSYSIATNGKPDASLSAGWFEADTSTKATSRLDGDESTQVLLPLTTLAHVPKAERAAVIGNGSGLSSHFLLGSPTLKELTTIDIEPEMINGSHTFYPVNKRVFDDPRSHYVHDDAKSYFAAANKKFDLILSEPSNPWVSGVSGLFTDEFYKRIRTYLTPNGVFGQWLHLYEIDDGLVLSVIQAVHKNFPSYEIYLTADVDILIVASNMPVLPKPDWSVYSLPNIQIDLKRFHLITPEAATGTLLVNREALAAVIGDAAGANSDFYPKLDLTTEQARFEKRFAKGFAGLGEDRFDLGALLASVKINPTDEPLAPLDIERVRFRAVSAALRAGRGPAVDGADRTRFRLAASKYQTLKDRMAAGHPPVDWTEFILLFHEVEKDLMGGTMGWSYDPFYDSVLQFCKAQNAPADAVATVKFMRAVSGYNWIEATAQIDALLFSLENGLKWIDQDTFRDGAVVALLKTGQNGKARQVFNRMAERTERKPHDLRVRMLGAAVAAVTVGDTARVKKQ
ncbi:MAG: fused MFS/spermidine synthase [Gemmatimonadetes bacterium]|nr:fused MFS/spermidine synthase [Gemmatimonadota bacterium]